MKVIIILPRIISSKIKKQVGITVGWWSMVVVRRKRRRNRRTEGVAEL
jgi:hypothetical protein